MSKISIELDKSFSDKLDEMIKTIELNIQKDLSGSLKISNYDRSIARCVLFEFIIRTNAASLCSLC